jgi:hypothetical protein
MQLKFRVWKRVNGLMMKFNPYTDRFMGKDIAEEKDWKVMLFTGYKDCDDIDIYEHDILSPLTKNSGNQHIVFEDGAFYVYNNFMRWGLLHDLFKLKESYKIKSIGNIYETPELLKRKTAEC